MKPEPINPVTFTGKTERLTGVPIKISVGRLGLISDRKEVEDGMHPLMPTSKNYVTCVVWKETPDGPEEIAHIVMDEDHFIRGIQHLFPHGELNVS